MTDLHTLIDSLYKDKYGQLVSLMLFRFPDLSIETAEDVVQEVFSEALTYWSEQGIPENQSGWLYQTCRNKSINLLKKKSKAGDLSLASRISIDHEEISEHVFKDARLIMLMACCHPHLAPKIQVVMALKYVANFKTENIARSMGVSLDAIEKMLYRARQKIKDETLVLSAKGESISEDRLSVVHKVIYLIFNEGYKRSGDDLIQGKALCEEALLLNKSIFDSQFCRPETKALQALMLFNAARFDTRFDHSGKPVELEYQDRSLWNRQLIVLAHQLLLESENTLLSQYHLEASIAFVHCSANTFGETNWNAICRYYEVLLEIYPSPFAEINYAVSLQYNQEFEKAYKILIGLFENPYFNQSYLLNISLSRYFERRNNPEEAKAYWERAERIKSAGDQHTP